jgi:prepilin-type processing-associated H-X9-DG protein
VLWTAPEDVVYDPNQPVPPLGGIFNTAGRFSLFGANRKRGFNAAFLDGSVRFLPIEVPPATLRALMTRDGRAKGPDSR